MNIYYLRKSYPNIFKFKLSDAILLEKKRLAFFYFNTFPYLIFLGPYTFNHINFY